MNKKLEALIISMIVISLISSIIPWIGILSAIISFVLYMIFKKNEKSIFYKENLEKKILETENLFKEKQDILEEIE